MKTRIVEKNGKFLVQFKNKLFKWETLKEFHPTENGDEIADYLIGNRELAERLERSCVKNGIGKLEVGQSRWEELPDRALEQGVFNG